MNIIESARSVCVPIHRQGYPFIIAFFIIAVLLGFIWPALFWLGLILTLWCVYFFRDPRRIIPLNPDIIVSPADGKISFAGPALPPPNLGLPEAEMLRISVFMDIFSCHVNRAPIGGRVKAINYRKGSFLNAELDKASEANEANNLILETIHGTIGVVQIAGLVARRIVCWAKPGDNLAVGQRFGLIRFGSRLDIYLPLQAQICVGLGQSMIAGETVLAHFARRGAGAQAAAADKGAGAGADKAKNGEKQAELQFRLD